MRRIYIAGSGGMLGEAFYKSFNKDFICKFIELIEFTVLINSHKKCVILQGMAEGDPWPICTTKPIRPRKYDLS